MFNHPFGIKFEQYAVLIVDPSTLWSVNGVGLLELVWVEPSEELSAKSSEKLLNESLEVFRQKYFEKFLRKSVNGFLEEPLEIIWKKFLDKLLMNTWTNISKNL